MSAATVAALGLTAPVAGTTAADGPLYLDNGVKAPNLESMVVAGKGTPRPYDYDAIRDLESLAGSIGRSLESLKKQYEGQEEFSVLLYDIQANSNYVNAGAPSAQGEPGWIQFTEFPADEVIRELESLGRPTRVVFGGELSDSAQSAASGAVLRSLEERGVMAPGTGVAGLDDQGTGVEAVFTRSEGTTDSDLSVAMREALEAAEKALGEVAVPIAITEEPGREPLRFEASIRGGFLLDSASGDCTSGFTATRSGNPGVITAKHCPNGMQFDGISNTLTFLAGASDAPGGGIDLQFHSTDSGHTTAAQFRAQNGDQRGVEAVSGTSTDSVVCHYGIGLAFEQPATGGKLCSNIDEVNNCYTVTGFGVHCFMANTDDLISTGVDSGGPWYFDNDAFGFHSGGSSTVGSVYTLINRAPNNLSATVKTTS